MWLGPELLPGCRIHVGHAAIALDTEGVRRCDPTFFDLQRALNRLNQIILMSSCVI